MGEGARASRRSRVNGPVFQNVTQHESTQSIPLEELRNTCLQADLINLEKYCTFNHLELNPAKCSVVTFSRKRNPLLNDYILKGERLQRNTVIRDLGVLHDSHLLFDKHIDYIVSKALRSLGFILRISTDIKCLKSIKILYCAFVRSNLEYASQVWNPRYATYIDRIENVQNKFIRYLCYRTKDIYHSNKYLNLCKNHHILPLQHRREIADITYLMKLLSSLIDCPLLLSKIYLKIPSRSSRTYAPIAIPYASSNYRQNSFMWRANKTFIRLGRDHNLDIFDNTHEQARRAIVKSFFE
ncbi:uncharacterized protein LOC143912355 [Arctopsyche grandis]|uniref:uncharacterized protein LOC143912355 n=1 Tax=Arctopsyche grandis TaxID=121162 RepID=UPI00406D92B3